jgi:hypothetical protein
MKRQASDLEAIDLMVGEPILRPLSGTSRQSQNMNAASPTYDLHNQLNDALEKDDDALQGPFNGGFVITILNNSY